MHSRLIARGLSSSRRTRAQVKKNAGKKLDIELDALRSSGAPLRASLDALKRAGVQPDNPNNIGRLIEHAVALRPCADTATEAYLRLGTDSCAGLVVVARAARLDPVAENRSNRVLSVLSQLRRSRMLPNAELLFSCFETAVSAADIRLAATIHNTAIASQYMTWPECDNDESLQYLKLVRSSVLTGSVVISDNDEKQTEPNRSSKKSALHKKLPPAIAYYNGLVRAALLSSSHSAAAAALRELHARSAGVNAETVYLLAAAHAELDDASGALSLLDSLPEPSPPLPIAALIRAAGRARDFRRVRMLFERALENDLGLSSLSVGEVPASRQTLAAAGDDVMLAALIAARASENLDGALWLLSCLDEMRSHQASSFVLGMVAETAWRTNHPDVARKIHARIRRRKSQSIAPHRIVKRTVVDYMDDY